MAGGGSVYAQKGSSGGSVYAQRGSSGGSVYAGGHTGSVQAGAPVKKSGGGGFLGAIKGGAHWVAKKSELAAHDIKQIPGGIIDLGSAEYHAVKNTVEHPWVSGKDKETLLHEWKHPLAPVKKGTASPDAQVAGLLQGQEKATIESFKHPLRDPFMTALNAGALLRGGAGVAARGSAVAREGSLAAGLKPFEPAPRLLKVGDSEVPLHASKNPLVRGAQAVHDKVVQKAIDTKPDGRVASYGTKRVGGSLDETARYQQRMRAVPAHLLQASAKKLAKLPGAKRVNQAALELTSVNTGPKEAAAYHLAQAEKQTGRIAELNALKAKGEFKASHDQELATLNKSVPLNRAVASLYETVDKRGMLTKNEHGDVIVNHTNHPKLAQTDLALAKVQGKGDEILARYGVRSPEELQKATDAPGKYRAGATYEKPTPGKTGVPSQALLKAQGRVKRLEALHERAVARSTEKAVPYGNVHTRTGLVKQNLKTAPEAAMKRQHVEVAPGPKTPGAPSDLPAKGINTPTVERLGGALSVARDELASLEKAAANRAKPTGVLGGETARPGRGHVSYASSEKKAPTSSAAASPGPVVGEAKAPITSHANTGFNLEHGKVPNNVTGHAARHYHQIVRFVNTTERRNEAIKAGTKIRKTERDVLVRVPGEDAKTIAKREGISEREAAQRMKIPLAINEVLGKEHLTADDVEGLHAALQAYKEDIVPGLRGRFLGDRQKPVGHPAPEGQVWVDKNILGDLAKPGSGPRGGIARTVDKVNSAVTAATVYFKIGHVGTRVLTNAATNIIQGSATPVGIKSSWGLWHSLSHEDKLRSLAAAGQHGFEAMPHEGTGVTAKVAGAGANWWAKHADAPFRFNSLAYEARKAGFDTPAKFRGMLDRLERPNDFNMNAAEHAKIDWVAKRSNRAQIAYDRLNEAERRFVTRGIWFYPWIKGATMFAGHTVAEHPYKAAVLSSAGNEGRQVQQQELGDVPSYEQGLFQLLGGQRPLVSDFSTFSPFATPADLLNAVARPGEAAGFLNPVAGATNSLINGINAQGAKSTSPITDALAQIASTTPESQILVAYLNRNKDQSKRMFRTTPLSALARSLVGPGLPRKVNPDALHSASTRERSGR